MSIKVLGILMALFSLGMLATSPVFGIVMALGAGGLLAYQSGIEVNFRQRSYRTITAFGPQAFGIVAPDVKGGPLRVQRIAHEPLRPYPFSEIILELCVMVCAVGLAEHVTVPCDPVHRLQPVGIRLAGIVPHRPQRIVHGLGQRALRRHRGAAGQMTSVFSREVKELKSGHDGTLSRRGEKTRREQPFDQSNAARSSPSVVALERGYARKTIDKNLVLRH
jgi:hypothetical protein